MTEGEGSTFRFGVVLLIVAGGVVLHFIELALLPFVLAAVLAFLTDPLIRAIQVRTRSPRWAPAIGVFLCLFGCLGALAAASGLTAFHAVAKLVGGGSAPLHAAAEQILGPRGVEILGASLTADQATDQAQQAAKAAMHPAALAKLGLPVFGAVIGLILFVIATFYMMISAPTLADGALSLISPAWRSTTLRLLPSMVKATRGYFLGVLVVVGFTTIAAWIGYGLVMHVRGALLLSVAVGFLETIPVIGPITAAALVGVAALQLHAMSAVIFMIVYAIALRLSVDDVVAPLILGKAVILHPVVIMLAYTLGAILFGIVGLLLAVPATACLRIWLNDRKERSSTKG